MKVVTPRGEKYRIHRRWLPWRRRARTDPLGWLPDVGSFGDDPVSLVIGAIVFIPVLLVLAFFFGELLLLLLLLPFFVVARSVFGTPWVIEVTLKREPVHVEAVKGWSESRERIERLATSIQQGEQLPARPQAPRPPVARGRARGRGTVDDAVQDSSS